MYNENRKKQFIDEKSKESIVTNNIIDMFKLSERFEENRCRDLCEWNTQEIIDLYKYYSTPSVQALVMLNNSLTMYANWCINNGLVPDNQNHFAEIKSETLCECIDFNALKSDVFTKEDLMEWLNKLPNYVDRFIFLAIFEGIPILNDCLINVRLSDLNGNTLTLINGDKRNVSDDLINIMHEAAGETVRMSLGEQRRNRDVAYVGGDTIIRTVVNSVYTDNNPTLLIGSRIRLCGKFLGLNNIRIKTIYECGRMWYIKRISEKYKCNIKEATVDHRKEHEKIYGRVQNMLTYSLTYGRLIDSLYS